MKTETSKRMRWLYRVPILVGVALGSISIYPFESLRVEHSKEYRLFTQAKAAYDAYEKEHGEQPKDLSFLPADMRQRVNEEGYPLEYDERLGLICLIRSPLGTTPSLKNYYFPPIGPAVMTVGKITAPSP